MKRQPFDEVCACEFEGDGKRCVCTKRKEQAKAACANCMGGNHKLETPPIMRQPA